MSVLLVKNLICQSFNVYANWIPSIWRENYFVQAS